MNILGWKFWKQKRRQRRGGCFCANCGSRTLRPLFSPRVCAARLHTQHLCFCSDLNTWSLLSLHLTQEKARELFWFSVCGQRCVNHDPFGTAGLSYAKSCVSHLPWPVLTSSSQSCKPSSIHGILPNTLYWLLTMLEFFLMVGLFLKGPNVLFN